jgi:hypothetical protein
MSGRQALDQAFQHFTFTFGAPHFAAKSMSNQAAFGIANNEPKTVPTQH